jgi:outer membrane protein
MKRQTNLTLIFLAFVVTISAQDTWSLEECIEYAIEQSLSVERADLNFQTAGVNQKEAKNARWPSLNANIGTGLNFGRVINPSTNSFETDNTVFSNYGINTSLPVFAGNQINNSIKRSKLDYEAANNDLKQARVQLAFDVANAFLNVLFAQENLRNGITKKELSQDQLDQTNKLIAAGSLPASDRYDILAQISLDQQSIVQFDNTITQSLLILKQLMRLEPDFDLRLENPDIQEDILGRIDIYSFEQVYQAALLTQPQFEAQQLRIESSILSEKIAQGTRFPTLSINASAVTNSTDLDKFVSGSSVSRELIPGLFVDGVPDRIEQNQVTNTLDQTPFSEQIGNNFGYGVSVNLSIPIYNNYRNKANVDRAHLNVLLAQNNDEEIKQILKTDIENALSSARAAKESLEASRSALDAAEIAYTNSEKRFDLGALNSYDLISAQNRLDSARVNLTISKYDYIFRILVVEYYLGKGLKYE